MLEEEDTYEPPEDPDSGMIMSSSSWRVHDNVVSGLSFEELGARALERLPRDRALDGIHAFNDMRYVLSRGLPPFPDVTFTPSDHLLEYLRPFAQQGKIVEEADVTRFFEAFKQKRTQVN